MTRIAPVVLCLVFFWSRAALAQNYSYGVGALSLTPRAADKMVELGVGTVRLAFGWDVIEPACKGCFDWSVPDAWRDEARRTNCAIYGILAYTPRWANGGQHYNYPPLRYQDWYDFVYAAAERYRTEIFLWGIWNEPNLEGYLHEGDLNVYQMLVSTARTAIQAANPDALVLGPEVSWHAVREGWYAAAMQSFGDLFDIVTVHWYQDGPQLEFMMDQLVRPFARGKRIWLSETGMKPCASAFGETGQAAFYQRVLSAFLPRRSWWTTVLFYSLYEAPTPRDCGSGMTRSNWSNRPAFLLYQAFINRYP